MKGYLGDFVEDAVVRMMFDVSDKDGGSVDLAGGSIRVYKDGSATEITAGASFAKFDTLTGIYMATIDTSASASYTPGSDYHVVLVGATVDTETVNAILGSFSIENRSAPAVPTVGAIADAVWDELLSGHTIGGSAGAALSNASTQAGNAASNSSAAVTLINGLNDLSAAEVNAQVDAAIETYRLDELFVAPLGSQPVAGSLLGDLTGDDGGTQRFTANALELAPTGSGGGGGGLTAGEIADAVWDELAIQHQGAGSFGALITQLLSDISDVEAAVLALDIPTVGEIADQVWDEAIAGHLANGSTGKALADIDSETSNLSANINTIIGVLATKPTAAQIADAVWSETIDAISYPTVLTAGYELRNISSLIFTVAGNIDLIVNNFATAQEIWEYDISAIATPGQAGDYLNQLPNVTVTDITAAALAKYATVPTGENATVAQSVCRLAQGAGGSGGSPIGSGAVLVTMTITDVQGTPQQDTEVWITTDPAGENVVAGTLETNAQGVVLFALDPGIHYRWAQKNGVQFTNPQQFTVVEL